MTTRKPKVKVTLTSKMQLAIVAFHALSSPHRAQVLLALHQAPEGGFTAQEMADILGMKYPYTYQLLGKLKAAQLVEAAKQQGGEVRYTKTTGTIVGGVDLVELLSKAR